MPASPSPWHDCPSRRSPVCLIVQVDGCIQVGWGPRTDGRTEGANSTTAALPSCQLGGEFHRTSAWRWEGYPRSRHTGCMILQSRRRGFKNPKKLRMSCDVCPPSGRVSGRNGRRKLTLKTRIFALEIGRPPRPMEGNRPGWGKVVAFLASSRCRRTT